MIRNYLLPAWRNLSRNKANAFMHVMGLTVAFTCCILLFLMVRHEFSYDQFQQNKDHLYKAYLVSYMPEGNDRSPTFGYPAAPAFKGEVPGIVKATPFMWAGAGIRYKDKEVGRNIVLVTNDFFSMFSFKVIAGNPTTPLASTGDVVLNEKTATAVFGTEDPIGKTVKVKVANEWRDLIVTAVLENAPDNSSMNYNILARIELGPNYTSTKDSWSNQHHHVFIQTAPNITQAQAEKNIRTVLKERALATDADLKNRGYRKDNNGDYAALKLAPLSTLHFDDELGTNNTINKTYLYTMMLIAIVVVVIACFNFINLNVARSLTRAKEVGVRKTVGAEKSQIFLQLWTESFLLFAFAVILAIGASMLLLKPFNALFTEELNLHHLFRPLTVLYIVLGMLVVSFLAGGYPAWLVARFNPAQVLKGKVSMNRSSALRNGLILFQFVMASLLICGTIVIYSQFQHMRTANMGFEQESVISIPVKKTENGRQYVNQLRMLLASQPQVTSVSGSSMNVGIGEDHSQSSTGIGFSYKDKMISTSALVVDYDYFKTLGIKPISGRDFSRDFPSDTSAAENTVVVTESMARQFGEKEVAGLSFYSDSAKPKWHIIGVIPDIYMYSVHSKVKPLTFSMNKRTHIDYILVKVKTGNPLATMNLVKDAYKQIEPDNTVNASFLTENTLRWYEKEQRLSRTFCIAAGIAIFLSCLGLFAIVSLVMEKRRKEIGVRKVLGATVSGITGLLSVDFVKLVLIAFVIATPIAWYFLRQWLQGFAYRITIYWWIFPLAGLVTLLIALVTISVQTIRAALTNPVNSLRSE
ncbi:FtsX-like permease family protein [Filimonas lacunae]|uniref:FtsX-like permease family protein n=1 Tax=Filimonas lacunae TaxID=477680 RepID=A0A173M9J8_9BACT|nr:ABC transporter permease [Filimonas lacunae]BAV04217.1 ABC transporter, permease protein [Filimonas lacunae]SIT14056.1 FtsX-like permease family protein [Filimonas lacunae]